MKGKKKVVIREVASPNLRVDVDGVRYELLCEYQAKNGVFHKVFIEETTNDVMIEIGKNSAIVGLFSAADDKIRTLFGYMEASMDEDDGMVCWQEGEMERYLERAMELGGHYPLIQKGMGLVNKVPMFYRQKAVDKELALDIEANATFVEHVVESEDYWEHEVSGLLDMGLDEDWGARPRMTQAGKLPEGWKWVDYDDGSGHLESPDGKKYFDYDRQPYYASGNIEYRETDDAHWGPFFDFDRVGSFSDFQAEAESVIAARYLDCSEAAQSKDSLDRDIVGGLKSMGEMKFYVVEDLKKNTGCLYYNNVEAAHERFQEALGAKRAMPALGVEIADGAVDLLHGINGEAVLVPDIYRKDAVWSEPMQEALGDIVEAARWLVLEGGGISYEYQNAIVPTWMQGDVKVLVPVTLGEKAPSSYCDDKVLKAEYRSGFDAIDSVYLEMHGWVAYDELLRHPEEYVADGAIKVQYLNVNYVKEQNVVGIDGTMDISPCEFKEMVERISKPYALVVYDGAQYTQRYRNKHDFIVASFDDAASAVKGWYELQERRQTPALVKDMSSTKQEVLFNGYDEDSKRMSFQQAAERFGFETEPGLDDVLSNASKEASERNAGKAPERMGAKAEQEYELD